MPNNIQKIQIIWKNITKQEFMWYNCKRLYKIRRWKEVGRFDNNSISYINISNLYFSSI